MPAAAPDTVTLGYVSRANGLRGAVVVHLDPSMTGVVRAGLAVELKPRVGACLRTRVLHTSQVRGGLRVAFDHVTDRDAAERLVGATIVVERGALGPLADGEYFDSDLIGLEVRTGDGRVLGRLVEVVATGANDVYVVQSGDGGEILVPAIRNAQITVDLPAGCMTVAADALEYGAASDRAGTRDVENSAEHEDPENE